MMSSSSSSSFAAPAMTLDVLPFKRVLAYDENGSEQLPVEPTAEEKPLTLLGRIDFGHTIEKDAKKSKTGNEAAAPAAAAPVWQWHGLVENLQQAHQELNIILDFITHVESSDAITVANMVKPKLLPQEAFNDLSVRASSKIREFLDVGRYLKRTAQALERQVEKEAVFYGALMRLQRNWKVKRQRSVAAGSGASAGFTIDTSFPLPADTSAVSSGRAVALSSVNLEQDSTGLLEAHPADGLPLNRLNLSLRSTEQGHMVWEDFKMVSTRKDAQENGTAAETSRGQTVADRGVGKGVDTGAKAAHTLLRHIQGVIYDEQVFDWVGREAVLPHSGMNVIGIGDTCLQFNLGNAASLTLKLSEIERHSSDRRDGNEYGSEGGETANGKWDASEATPSNHLSARGLAEDGRNVHGDSSLVVCLHQAFHQAMFGFPVELDPGLVTFKLGINSKSNDKAGMKAKEGTAGAGGKDAAGSSDGLRSIRHFAAMMRHRVLSNNVGVELEKQVANVPNFQLLSHPTWHPRVSAWDLSLATPSCSTRERSDSEELEVRFQCTVVLRDDSLFVDGLEGDSQSEAPFKVSSKTLLPLRNRSLGISELPNFLLLQVASVLVSWVHDEAICLGLKVSREMLSVVFELENCDDISLVACPNVQTHSVNWWMRSSSLEDEYGTQHEEPDAVRHQRLLGPINLDKLRKVMLDIVSIENDADSGFS